jgi:thiamine monophosphate kinase
MMKRIKIDTAASGDSLLVVGEAGKSIIVVAYMLQQAAAVTAKFKSGTRDITGPMPASHEGSYNPVGHFATEDGESLYINLSAAVQVGGYLTYLLE